MAVAAEPRAPRLASLRREPAKAAGVEIERAGKGHGAILRLDHTRAAGACATSAAAAADPERIQG